MKVNRLAVVILSVFGLIACKPDVLSPEALSAYVADGENGLQKSVSVGQTVINVTYRPTDLWVLQETGTGPIDATKIEALRKKYGQYYYFILSLSDQDKEALHQASGEQYSELVQTLSFRMNEYVTLTTTAQDTIPVGDFMLNRTYGLNKSTDLLFVFSREQAIGRDWVQFNLNEFGLGAGNQRFRFRTIDLEEVPAIDFEYKH